ncbi:hypothetical protein JCM10908_003432 [Rhodotorula pacifica]|uniref:uncharacterized protein n=1 Tax=Rhodotorula pacifica TaxID=1495444 RepID=UPI00317BE7CF
MEGKKCSYSWGSELARTLGPVQAIVDLDDESLLIEYESRRLFLILAVDLELVLYLYGDADGSRQYMAVHFVAEEGAIKGGSVKNGGFDLRLDFGTVGPEDSEYSALVETFQAWQQKFGFAIGHLCAILSTTNILFAGSPDLSGADRHRLHRQRDLPPALLPESIAVSDPRRLLQLPLLPDQRCRETDADCVAADGEEEENTPAKTPSPKPKRTPTAQRLDEPAGPFKYLSEQQAQAEWTAGFWVRLFAIIRAISPHAGISYPEFTREEIVMLSYQPDACKLPKLPKTPCSSAANHNPVARLGLEHIYQDKHRLALEQSRNVLMTDAFPDLRQYAITVGKIVHARDLFLQACDRILELGARADSRNKLPKKHVDLIQNLRDSEMQFVIRDPLDAEQSRNANSFHFSRDLNCIDKDGQLVRSSPFGRYELESSARHRFEEALRQIVAIEDELRKEEGTL